EIRTIDQNHPTVFSLNASIFTYTAMLTSLKRKSSASDLMTVSDRHLNVLRQSLKYSTSIADRPTSIARDLLHSNHIRNSVSDLHRSFTMRELVPFKQDLYFQTTRLLDKHVEEIRRTVMETKEVVIENSRTTSSANTTATKAYLNVDQISDQVYQNLERRIRTERERRGM
ncbi:MAG TPA: hypothetical protein VLH08_17925, partial [Acidobacteriota bacterium]|nr:hypothetical protein [Acidobacteriota bacterium]